MKKQKIANEQLSLFSDEDFVTPNDNQELSTRIEKSLATQVVEQRTEAATDTTRHYDLTNLFTRLAQSNFRSSFHLKLKDWEYIDKKGLDTIRQHAADFVSKRLAPAFIPNDGQQTPMRGHPVFIAQHATGCCCRGCFCKWHHIPQGRALSPIEQAYAVEVLMTWITREYNKKQ